MADRPPVDFYFPGLADFVVAHKEAISNG